MSRPQSVSPRRFSVRKPVLWMLALAFLALIGMFLHSQQRFHALQETLSVERTRQRVAELVPFLQSEQAVSLGQTLRALGRIQSLQRLFLAGDRKGLQREATTLFQELGQGQRLSHFYFFDREGRVFLRLHAPEWFGDTPDRVTLRRAMGEGRGAAGLELGLLGHLAYRVVHPWVVDGETIGYLELAVDWEGLQNRLAHLAQCEMFTFLPKSMLQRDTWEQGQVVLGRKGDWNADPRWVVAGGTRPTPPPGLLAFLSSNATFILADDLPESMGEKRFHFFRLPLADLQGKEVAVLGVASVDDALARLSREHLLRVVVASLLVALVLLFASYRFLTEVENDLATASRENRENTLRRRAILETSREAVLTIDQNGVVVELNPAAVRLTGFPREELLGRNIADTIIPGEHREAHRKGLARFLSTGETCLLNRMMEMPLEDAHGHRIPVEIVVMPVPLEGGILFTAYLRDITERKQMLVSLMETLAQAETANRRLSRESSLRQAAEREARLERDRLRAILESMEERVFIVNRERRILFANHVVTRELGEAVGMDCDHFFAPVGGGSCPWCQVVTEPSRENHARWEWEDPHGHTYDMFATPLPGGEERGSWLCVMHDVTERKRMMAELAAAKEEAEEASQAKSSFLSHVSHDLRTPLSAILGMAEMLLSFPDLTPEARRWVNLGNRAAEILLSLVNDLLDLSKIEAGQMVLEPRPFHLRAVLEEVVGLLSVRAMDLGVDLVLHAPEERMVLGDGERLRQVLLNLVANAVKFTPKGEVVLEVTPLEAGTYHFEVRDTGIGIPAESLPFLFKPFSQANAGIARAFGGTGLGLTICKQLLALMQSDIRVESEAGKGSRFSFALSLPDTRPEGRLPRVIPTKLGNISLLLVEDTLENQMIVQAYLASQPCRLTVVGDGLEGVAAFCAGQYHLVLMDMGLPRLDGYEATRRIRQWEKENGRVPTPILAFTASAMREDRERILAAGCDEVFAKPLNRERLIGAIAIHARKPEDATPPCIAPPPSPE